MKQFNVSVRPGSDPSVLSRDPSLRDPSGFKEAGFTSRARIAGFCDHLEDIYEKVLTLSDKDMAGEAPREIEVYCDPRDTNAPHGRVKTTRSLEGEARWIRLSSFPWVWCTDVPLAATAIEVSPFIVLSKKSFAFEQTITRAGMHEGFHLVTSPSLVENWWKEALTHRLETCYCGPDPEVSILHDYDFAAAVSTCGFCMEKVDQFSVCNSEAASQAFHLSAAAALCDISAENIWRIWKILYERRKKGPYVPILQDVRAAVEDVLQERADGILRQSACQTMGPQNLGPNAYILPRKRSGNGPPSHVDMHVFNIERNNHYGATKFETDSNRYLCTDINVPVRSQLIDKNGKLMTVGHSKLGGLLALKWAQLHPVVAEGHGQDFAAKLGKFVLSFGGPIGNVEIGPG